MTRHDGVLAFRREDHNRTLFPLTTASVLIESSPSDIANYIYTEIDKEVDPEDQDTGEHFLAQEHAFADKSGFHLRRTLRLDPIAEFYLYDVVYRNRARFRKKPNGDRTSFGYTFSSGSVPPPSKSYREYSEAINRTLKQYKYVITCDISCYFNSIYHHDLVARFRSLVDDTDEVELFGRFFREINSGRSTDCLPHGIVPAKVLGSDFLAFADESKRVRAPIIYRFMDDFCLFSNREEQLIGDFYCLQDLLSGKGLFVNPAKTRIEETIDMRRTNAVGKRKMDLLKRRRDVVLASDGTEDDDLQEALDEGETEYLLSLLEEETVAEEDAELALTLLRNGADDVLEHLDQILRSFPSLAKNAYHFCGHVKDKTALANILLEFIKSDPSATEFQLFWIARTAENYLARTAGYGDILQEIYEHERSTIIVKAKILECPEKRFGLPDLREAQLKSGGAGWLPWAAAVGSICEKKANRNHLLGYFANASPVNRVFARIIKEHPGV